MARALLPVEESLVLLAETPALLTECARGLTPAQLRSTPRSGGWSELEVLGHLRACADMWGGSAREIAARLQVAADPAPLGDRKARARRVGEECDGHRRGPAARAFGPLLRTV